LILAAVVAVAGLATLMWFWVTAGEVTTDNAYVDADVAQVTPLYGGPVAAAYVSNTDVVKKGQVLVVLDSADAKLALAEAEANLGQVQRKVRGYFANDAALGGQVNSRDADIAHATAQLASAQADFERARVELSRRQALSASGAVSGDELTQAENSFSRERGRHARRQRRKKRRPSESVRSTARSSRAQASMPIPRSPSLVPRLRKRSSILRARASPRPLTASL
jgi:membrane fusion protein (multidrug efflux system)